MKNFNKLIGQEIEDKWKGQPKTVTIIDAEEFVPQKRTLRMIAKRTGEDGKRVPYNYNLFLQFPYMQFYTAEQDGYKFYYITATEKPFNEAERFVKLPLPNVYDNGQVIIDGGDPIQYFVEYFWQTRFSEEWKSVYHEHCILNNIGLGPQEDRYKHSYCVALEKWQEKTPAFSTHKECFLNNTFPDMCK